MTDKAATDRDEIEAKIKHHAERIAHWCAKLAEITEEPLQIPIAHWRAKLAKITEEPLQIPIEIDGKVVTTLIFDDGEGEPTH